MTERFFATCPRGLEAFLADDLSAVGGRAVKTVPGGAAFHGDWSACYRANLESRIATRVLWQVGYGTYRREDDLYRLARSLPWPRWFDVERTVKMSVTAIQSPLRSLDFITLRVKDAVCDRFRADCGKRPSVDTERPDLRVHVFLRKDEATLYLDTSGEPLYKRGLRRASVQAPLKENLAAGILQLARWNSNEPLLDPMCGGGTFLVEAAQIALNIAPGLRRSFAFEKLRGFDEGTWSTLRAAATERMLPSLAKPIYGSDDSEGELRHARDNLEAANLSSFVQLQCVDVLELMAPARGGAMVTNPPYGVRLADGIDHAAFYPRLGDTLKRRFVGWRCYLFSADQGLPKLIGLRASRRTPLFNGPLECRLYEYRMMAGSLRDETESGRRRESASVQGAT